MILLDTHALIWYATGDPRLSSTARTLIGAPGNCYSAASIWEAAIKSGIGKLDLRRKGKRVLAGAFFSPLVSALQLRPLTITLDDAAAVESLPAYHNDPFDRLLIAQAKLRGLDLVSADEVFDSYGIRRIW